MLKIQITEYLLWCYVYFPFLIWMSILQIYLIQNREILKFIFERNTFHQYCKLSLRVIVSVVSLNCVKYIKEWLNITIFFFIKAFCIFNIVYLHTHSINCIFFKWDSLLLITIHKINCCCVSRLYYWRPSLIYCWYRWALANQFNVFNFCLFNFIYWCLQFMERC